MKTMARSLRDLLLRGGITPLAGAHDALSARLVEETGFEGVWASGFGVAVASRCLPDADLLSMTEVLQVVKPMVDAVGIPVLADCNSGFGNVSNVGRMVREFEMAGVAGVCIEDNPFPKRCSLYEGWDRDLVPLEEMAAKVRAAKSVQRDPDFVVIARVESLIAGEGVEAALARASAYADAGADAVLVHAKRFAPLAEVARAWSRPVPLVVVPTLFSDVGLADLERHGFRLAIFANHPVRAAITAVRQVLHRLRESGVAADVEGEIAPLAEVNRLVGVDRLRAEEERALFPATDRVCVEGIWTGIGSKSRAEVESGITAVGAGVLSPTAEPTL